MVEDVLSARDVSALPDDLHRMGVIGFAVRSTWRYVLEGVIAASGIALPTLLTRGGPLIWSIRVMAVLMCPDASCHPAVREHCWEPIVRLGSAEVRQVVRERLIHVFWTIRGSPKAGTFWEEHSFDGREPTWGIDVSKAGWLEWRIVCSLADDPLRAINPPQLKLMRCGVNSG